MAPRMKSLSVGFISIFAFSGCAQILSAFDGDSGSSQEKTMADVEAAKKAKDLKALSDICTIRGGKTHPDTMDAACLAAIDHLAEKGDSDALDKICNRKAPYKSWRQSNAACKAKGRIASAGALQAFNAASCDDVVSVWNKDYRSLTSKHSLGKDAARANFVAAAKKFVECGKWDFVIERMAHWGQDTRGMGYHLIATLGASGTDWEKQFFAYAKSKGGGQAFGFEHAVYFLSHYTDYLVKNNKMNCKPYVAVAAKTPDKAFGPLNWYFRKTNCTEAVKIIATRLASDRAGTRSGACKSLGALGSKKKHLKKVRLLANKDPYYWLKKKDNNGRVLLQPIKVYDVRNACAAAANKLELK